MLRARRATFDAERRIIYSVLQCILGKRTQWNHYAIQLIHVKYKLPVEILWMPHNADFYIKCVVWLEGYWSSYVYWNKQNYTLLLFHTLILMPIDLYLELQEKKKDYLWLYLWLAVIMMMLLIAQLDLQVSFPLVFWVWSVSKPGILD